VTQDTGDSRVPCLRRPTSADQQSPTSLARRALAFRSDLPNLATPRLQVSSRIPLINSLLEQLAQTQAIARVEFLRRLWLIADSFPASNGASHVDAARAPRSILFHDNVLCCTLVVCRHVFLRYMSPGIHLAPGRDRRRGMRDGDQMDLQTLDSTTTTSTITTDMATLAED
jgi:hypothetical protein